MAADEPIDGEAEFLIAQVTGNPVAMVKLAQTFLIPRGQTRRAQLLCEAAVELAPEDGEVRALAQVVRSRAVGGWYFSMVQDHPRHALYAQAFRKIFTPGCTVLDIGAGTGLFAMLAVREGAGKVVACERNGAVADAARQIIDRNCYSDRITIVEKDSRELEIGIDLDAPADILLWDNLSNDLLSVGAVDSIEDARRRLLKPDAAIIPQQCEMRVALIEATPPSDFEMGFVDGFDLTPFNRFRPTQRTLGRNKFEPRSDAATLFDFDFAADVAIEQRSDRAVVTATGGRVNGIAQWLRFRLADDILYDTRDDAGVTAFGVQYHAVESFTPEPGQRMAICGSHDRLRTWFWIGGEAD
jgi:protein arginine N-methyltransferase 7